MAVDPSGNQPTVRISDAERQLVDARLRQALGEGRLTLGEYEERTGLVWAARTAADLTPLTADLPATRPPATPAWSGAPMPQRRRGFALLAERRIKGVPYEGQVTHASAVLGHVTVDLRYTDLPPVVEIRATAFMGGVDVYVPVGVHVEVSGFDVLGGRSEDVESPVAGATIVRVHGHTVFGGLTVTHGPADKQVRLPR